MVKEERRRTAAEAEALYKKAQVLVEGGKTVDEAAKEAGAGRTGFHRWRAKHGLSQARHGGRKAGSVDVSSLPPRPKRGGHRPRKPVDLNDIGSVAMRLSRIDKQLRNVKPLMQERKTLAAALTKLLKGVVE